MNKFPQNLSVKVNQRKQNNALRNLSILEGKVDFYSNDYIGFASNTSISKNAIESLENLPIKNGSTGSRLISGTHAIHLLVEKQIAEFHKAEEALLFNSGYDANVGLFSSVLQKGDVVLYDELIHASVRDGIQMSYAKAYKFKHNNVEDLELKLKRFCNQKTNVYVAIESIYSMDGDKAPLKELVALSKKYNCFLIVDEAHSNAVYGTKGNGLVCELGLENDFFARVHTFGKALGCHGAVVLGAIELKDYLINFSRSFIYTTAIPLHAVATIKSAYKELEITNSIDLLRDNVAYFKNQLIKNEIDLYFVESDSAIHCCIIPGNNRVKAIANKIIENGFAVKPILSPTVKQGEERLRICLHSYNTQREISDLVSQLSKLLNEENFNF